MQQHTINRTRFRATGIFPVKNRICGQTIPRKKFRRENKYGRGIHPTTKHHASIRVSTQSLVYRSLQVPAKRIAPTANIIIINSRMNLSRSPVANNAYSIRSGTTKIRSQQSLNALNLRINVGKMLAEKYGFKQPAFRQPWIKATPQRQVFGICRERKTLPLDIPIEKGAHACWVCCRKSTLTPEIAYHKGIVTIQVCQHPLAPLPISPQQQAGIGQSSMAMAKASCKTIVRIQGDISKDY